MAFNNREIVAVWRGVDELTPTMNRISNGLTNMGRVADTQGGRVTRQLTLWDQMMRRVRISAEYMVAGFGLYKLQQAFQNYQQFQQLLGGLNANINVNRASLNQFANTAIDVSNRTAVPVNQVLESFQNLAQSFPNIQKNARQYLFPVMAEIEAKASNILSSMGSGVAPAQFGAVTLQAARAFYGPRAVLRSVARNPNGRNLLEQTAGTLVGTLQQIPGATGAEFVSALPSIFGGATAGGFTMQEALALFAVMQRNQPGRATQNAQYLRQLMIRLRRPTPQAESYLQQSHVLRPGESVGGWELLRLILEHAQTMAGGPKGLQTILRQSITTGNTQTLQGSNAGTFILSALAGKTAAGRMQSLIALQALARAGLPDLNKQVDNLTKHTRDLNAENQRYLQTQPFMVAANKMSNFSLQFIRTLSPLLNVMSRAMGEVGLFGQHLARIAAPLLGTAGHSLNASRTWLNTNLFPHAGDVLGGALGFLGARHIGITGPLGRRLARIPGPIGRVLSRVFAKSGALSRIAGADAESGVLNKVGGLAFRGPLEISAMGSAITGQANGTPNAPFWVVIHPLSMMTVPQLFGGKGPGPGGSGSPFSKWWLEQWAKKVEKIPGVKQAEGAAAVAARSLIKGSRLGWSDIGEIGSRLATIAGPAAALIGGDVAVAGYGQTRYRNGKFEMNMGMGNWQPVGGAIGQGLATRSALHRVNPNSFVARYIRNAGKNGKDVPAGLINILGGVGAGAISEPRAEAAILNYLANNLPSSGQIPPAALKYLGPIMAMGNRGGPLQITSDGQHMKGEVEVTINLTPTGALAKSVKKDRIRVTVPTYWRDMAPAPTSRGRTVKRGGG